MSRPHKQIPNAATSPKGHREVSRMFARHPGSSDRVPLTHETLAADLVAFHRDGGTIEVLGTTYTRSKPGQDGKPILPADGSPAAKHRR